MKGKDKIQIIINSVSDISNADEEKYSISIIELKCAVKSGRIPTVTAFLGSVLNLEPVIMSSWGMAS